MAHHYCDIDEMVLTAAFLGEYILLMVVKLNMTTSFVAFNMLIMSLNVMLNHV